VTKAVFCANDRGELRAGTDLFRCAIGKGGLIAADAKREGDGASPIGDWPMRRVFYRADRLARPQTQLPCIPLRPQDGWCDDPAHPLYNRPVTRPFAASHEALWREDHVYDVIVELDHNQAPAMAGRGSAIFFHLAHADYRPTEGCIAVALDDMRTLLTQARPGLALAIQAAQTQA
jgi:L,D-peptidoglycan transpeptidase YkuD (ErfK/YbiS/YcfS/YnhG family)